MVKEKLCKKCKNLLPIEKFNKHQTNTDGFTGSCGKCIRAHAHKRHLVREFNLTSEQYEELFFVQNGCCGICGIKQDQMNRRLAVDHDHQTGGIRGLLCMSCNIVLGKMKDSVHLLSRAIGYLAKEYYDPNDKS